VIRSARGKTTKVGMADGRIYDADILGIDAGGDIAMIKLKGKDAFPYVPMGDSDTVQMGEWTLAMGNPFTLATDFKPTVTTGIVSGVERFLPGVANNALIYTGCIQVDTSINPGNSGGPLFNMKGELIGINGRISLGEGRGRVNVGAGYAIPINQIRFFIPDLKDGKQVRHALLGVTEMEDTDRGVKILDLKQYGAAQRAGLREGDIITHFAGEKVRSLPALRNRVGERPAGDVVTLTFVRGGKPQNMEVKLGVRPLGVQRGPRMATLSPYSDLPDVPPKPATDPKSPAEVLDRYAKAVGREAYADIETIAQEGELAALQGTSAPILPMKVLLKPPATLRRETTVTARGTKIKQLLVVNPDGGWQIAMGNVQRMADEELDDYRRRMALYEAILHGGKLLEPYELSYLGVGKVYGQPADVVKALDPARFGHELYFDRETGLLIKHDYVSSYTGEPMAVKNVAFTEVPVGERTVTLPSHIEVFTDGVKTQDQKLASVEVNVEAPEGAFDPESKYNETKRPKPRRRNRSNKKDDDKKDDNEDDKKDGEDERDGDGAPEDDAPEEDAPEEDAPEGDEENGAEE
jgi:S1-C subfamily serine protease